MAKWARRKPTLAAAYSLGLLALLLGGLGGAAVWQWRAAEQARVGEAKARASAEKARDGEATARMVAEEARDGEKTARAAAEKARDGEATARESSPGSSTAERWKWPFRSGATAILPPPWPCTRILRPTSAAGSGVMSIASAIPTCSRSRGHQCGDFGVVQPGRVTNRHRQF